MPYYMIQLAYTPEAWATLIKNPVDRIEVVRPSVEGLGGKMDQGWLSFGEYDLVAICEFPENVTAAAFSLAVSAGGAVKSMKTTPLMTTAEGVKAMKKAGKAAYQPPG